MRNRLDRFFTVRTAACLLTALLVSAAFSTGVPAADSEAEEARPSVQVLVGDEEDRKELGATELDSLSDFTDAAEAVPAEEETEASAPSDAEAAMSAAEKPEEAVPAGMMKSWLTGEYVPEAVGNRRPVAFMIDNVKDADPPSGISQADLYYECEVETDLSRICAVFENYDELAKIGPLRSCRDYFISLAAGLDDIYCHYGQAAYALPYLESDDVDNLSGLMSYPYNAFYRDSPHAAPHNAYTGGEQINELIKTLGYRTDHREGYKGQLNFRAVGDEDPLSEGRDAAYVKIGYPFNDPYFVYDEETGLYSRFQHDSAHTDLENGEQLKVKNIILEYQSGARYQDTVYLHYHTWNAGKGKYISNGKAVDITWARKTFYSPVVYKTADGKPLEINTGKTWINIIRKDQLKDCLIGTSPEDASCVADEATVAAEEAKMEKWVSWYKEIEESYLTKMAQMRTDNVAKHGGKTKVEVGLP